MNATLMFLALMVPGTIFLGVYDVLIRKVLRDGKVNEQLFLGFDFLGVGLLMIIPLAFVGIPELKPGFWGAAFTTGILNIFGQWAWYAAFRREGASLISPLRLLTPPLVVLTGYFVLREIPTAGGVLGIIVTLLGLWFLFQSEATAAAMKFFTVVQRQAIILGFLGAIFNAASLPFDKKVVMTSSGFFGILIINVLIGIASIVIALVRARGRFSLDLRRNWRFFLALLPVHSAASYLTFVALNYTFVAYAASVKRLWSFWAVLFSGKFLEEKNIGKKILATVVMLAGIAVTLLLG